MPPLEDDLSYLINEIQTKSALEALPWASSSCSTWESRVEPNSAMDQRAWINDEGISLTKARAIVEIWRGVVSLLQAGEKEGALFQAREALAYYRDPDR